MNSCLAHLERTGQRVEAYKLGLCEDCFHGKPIRSRELLGERSSYWIPVEAERTQ